MDCCSKYPDYRHPLIGGPAIGGGAEGGGPPNGSYYSHPHPSIRYHQQSMYRLSTPGPGGFNGIGPPAVGPPATPSLYPNYERYGSFSNLPSYVYNASGFGYGNLSGREVSGYYGPYEGLGRGEVGFGYHNYRGLHDAAGVHGPPRGAGYHMYPHPGRDLYPTSPAGFHSHPGGAPAHHHHHNPQHNHLHHFSASKDSFMSQMSDLSSGCTSEPRGGGCAGVNDGNSFNSEITAPPLINGGGPADGMIGGGLAHGDYSALGATYQRTDSAPDSGSGGGGASQHHQHSQQNSPHGMHHIATGFPYGLKDSKLRRPAREKDKCFAKMSLTSRRMECATPLDTSPRFERADTPFTPHPHSIKSSPTNIPPRLPSNFMLANQPNGSSSPFPNSPNSWTQQCSPRPMRKRSYSPRPQPPPAAQLTPSKNRVLECDFIPCKKSRKKIKTEHPDSSYEIREEIKNITPLPGFQQAFGSTEIGRFSETFLNTPDSPYEQVYESEADTLSPQPWETGDSLEGPHLNLHIGASVQPMYPENRRSMDSPVDGNYFSGIRCNY